MKLTLNQRQNILNGDRKIKEKANHAITVLIYGCEKPRSIFLVMYCIESGQTQQCAQCQLIDGRLINKDGYIFPNCEGTQWVAVKSLPGTNNTPFYKVVPLPLDSWLLAVFMAVFGTLTILKTKIL